MNETLKTIFNRTSTKSYIDKPVEEDKLELVLQAGTMAPSAMNKQSAILIAVTNKEILNEIISIGMAVRNGKDCFYGAPCLILVCADSTTPEPIKDGSCVMENMMLAAESLGLGSCWINCIKDFRKVPEGVALFDRLGIDEKYLPVAICTLGYGEKGPYKEKKQDYYKIIK